MVPFPPGSLLTHAEGQEEEGADAAVAQQAQHALHHRAVRLLRPRPLAGARAAPRTAVGIICRKAAGPSAPQCKCMLHAGMVHRSRAHKVQSTERRAKEPMQFLKQKGNPKPVKSRHSGRSPSTSAAAFPCSSGLPAPAPAPETLLAPASDQGEPAGSSGALAAPPPRSAAGPPSSISCSCSVGVRASAVRCSTP